MPNEMRPEGVPIPDVKWDSHVHAEGPDSRVTSRNWDAERRYIGHPTTACLVVPQEPRAL
jgi:hypothetical protein